MSGGTVGTVFPTASGGRRDPRDEKVADHLAQRAVPSSEGTVRLRRRRGARGGERRTAEGVRITGRVGSARS